MVFRTAVSNAGLSPSTTRESKTSLRACIQLVIVEAKQLDSVHEGETEIARNIVHANIGRVMPVRPSPRAGQWGQLRKLSDLTFTNYMSWSNLIQGKSCCSKSEWRITLQQ